MEIATIFTSIGMMAVIILMGIITAQRIKVTPEAKQVLMFIIINISVPSIILNGIFNTHINNTLVTEMLVIFIISIIFNALAILLGWGMAYLVGFHSQKAKKLAILGGLGNTGFIGIPLCATIFGPVGGLLAAIFDSGLDVVVFTLVVILLQEDEKFSFKQLKAVINVPIIAIVVGFTVALSGYHPPIILKDLTASLASLAAPLAMLYIGFLIPNLFKQRKKVEIRSLSFPLVVKLMIIPLVLITILQWIPINEDIKQIVYIQVSMPTFMLATVLFARYTRDEDIAVLTTVYSTIFSLVTIPLITYFIYYVGFVNQ